MYSFPRRFAVGKITNSGTCAFQPETGNYVYSDVYKRQGTFPQYAAIVLDAWRERTLVTELQSLAISGRTADEMTAELERMGDEISDASKERTLRIVWDRESVPPAGGKRDD